MPTDADDKPPSSAHMGAPSAAPPRAASSTSSSEHTADILAASSETLTLEQALAIAGWPSSLLAASKQPWVLDDVRVFKELLLFGSHLDRIVVLRDGVARLGLESALPADVAAAAEGETSVRRFIERLGDDDVLRGMRGRVYCTPPDSREERELKKDADGADLDTLADKRRALGEAGRDPSEGVYLGELRRAQRYRHSADGSWSKSLLSRGVCDSLGTARARAMPYWDRYDEGLFVGAQFGGSPLHVDQVLWSNVGKNWRGHKLLVIWPYGERSRDLFDDHNYALFIPPLSADESRALEAAAQVALLGPGDCVLFSGGNAHMALSVSQTLSLTAYESFVNLHPRNLSAFLDSGTPAQYRQCRTRQPMLDDIKRDVSETLNDLCADLEDGKLRDDPDLEAAAPAAIDALRHDDDIAERVAPLRPARRRRRA